MIREDHLIPSGNEKLAAWLYRPDTDGDTGCVVIAHGLSAVRDQRLGAYGERFAAAGFAALVFDYRYLGDSGGHPRGLVDPRLQREDYHAAIRYARGLSRIDPERIAVWGNSLSGGNVLLVAAEDRRLAAVIAQAPALDALRTMGSQSLPHRLHALAAAVRDQVGAWLGRPARTLPLAAEDHLCLLPHAETLPGMRAMTPPGTTWANAVTARTVLRMATFRPITRVHEVTAPLFIVVCDRDFAGDPALAEAAAHAAPRAIAKHYDCGHFDILIGDWFDRAVADQAAFLGEHLSAAT